MTKGFNLKKVRSGLDTELKELFKDNHRPYSFLYAYFEYCHLIDDLVDEPKNAETIRKASALASSVFNCDYWKQHGTSLYLVDRITHNTYFDSVVWEKSSNEYLKRDAKVLSHCGYNMLFAVILIEYGEWKLQELSLKFREYAHLDHAHDPL